MKKFFKWFFITIAGILGFIILVSIISVIYVNNTELTQTEKDSIQLVKFGRNIAELEQRIKDQETSTWNAKTLLNYYESNELKADNELKGKSIIVRGIIQNFGKDVFDNPYISLGMDEVNTIQCLFSKSSTNSLANLNKGQTVTITGDCNGKALGFLLILDKCELTDDIQILKAKLEQLKAKN